MYGDRNTSSMPDVEAIAKMSVAEKKKSFLGKNVYQRMAIVIAGPVANFILAIVIFTFLFKANGLNKVLPIIDEVMPQSAALDAGLQKGDEIIAINNDEITDFNQIRDHVIKQREVSEIKPLDVTCSSCSHKHKQAFTLDLASFFGNNS